MRGYASIEMLHRIVARIGALEKRARVLERKVGGATILTGTGSPNGSQTASVGALYLRLDGGASTTLYVKESGSLTDTGWVAK